MEQQYSWKSSSSIPSNLIEQSAGYLTIMYQALKNAPSLKHSGAIKLGKDANVRAVFVKEGPIDISLIRLEEASEEIQKKITEYENGKLLE